MENPKIKIVNDFGVVNVLIKCGKHTSEYKSEKDCLFLILADKDGYCIYQNSVGDDFDIPYLTAIISQEPFGVICHSNSRYFFVKKDNAKEKEVHIFNGNGSVSYFILLSCGKWNTPKLMKFFSNFPYFQKLLAPVSENDQIIFFAQNGDIENNIFLVNEKLDCISDHSNLKNLFELKKTKHDLAKMKHDSAKLKKRMLEMEEKLSKVRKGGNLFFNNCIEKFIYNCQFCKKKLKKISTKKGYTCCVCRESRSGGIERFHCYCKENWFKWGFDICPDCCKERKDFFKTIHQGVKLDEVLTWPEYVRRYNVPQSTVNFKLPHAIVSKISLYFGSATDLFVDAVVNSTDHVLGNASPMSKAIHNFIGDDLGKELRRDYPSGIWNSKVAVTKGFNLNAKYIIHAAHEKKCIEKSYQNILKEVGNRNFKSVAFCCIGVGKAGLPIESTTKKALECCQKWMLDNHQKIERMIFCVFSDYEKEIYLKLLPEFFPAVFGCVNGQKRSLTKKKIEKIVL